MNRVIADITMSVDGFVTGPGADVVHALGLDVLQLHLFPEVLGRGTPLFADVGRHRLVQPEVRVSATATHLTYDVRR